jgi:hypothetical protein
VQLRRRLLSNEELNRKMNQLEQKYEENIQVIFAAFRKLLATPDKPRRKISFRREEK